jgi:hypothetical protein
METTSISLILDPKHSIATSLSFAELLLTEISSFLDAPDLCRADASCKSFQRANIRGWQQKEDESMVSLLLQSEAPTAKERVTKFRNASKKAWLYQTLAPQHGRSVDNSGRCYDCDQYPDLDVRPRDHPEEYEFFCRIGRRTQNRVFRRPPQRLILQGFLKWNHRCGLLELPEEVDLKQEWKQLGTLLQALTRSSNNIIHPRHNDRMGNLKKAAMSNLSVTLVAVPRASIYQAPTLVSGANMVCTGNPQQWSREEHRIYFNDEYLQSHARRDHVVEDGGFCRLCLSIGMSEDEPARLRGVAF